jgi:hypothetical protein
MIISIFPEPLALLPTLSFGGFVLYLSAEKKIRIQFAPVIVCCLLGIMMVISGFFGMMRRMVYFLCFAGCGCC